MVNDHEPATLPPPGLAGLDPAWSRLVDGEDAEGAWRTWHVLDTAATDIAAAATGAASAAAGTEEGAEQVGTVLCVHGNPTWSYAFRTVLAQPPAGWRVVAVDHLDLGFSERTGTVRRLADRIDDLDRVVDALEVTGPVVLVAHDWGGPIALGWAEAHPDQVAGVVLTNTAVHQPAGSPAPALIRAARRPGVLETLAVRTTGFLRGALALSRPSLPAEVRAGYLAPYATPARREAIGAFVRDIPLEPDHPSAARLDAVATGLEVLADTPVLLLWGPADPVFSDRYLHDFEARLPHARVHRVEGASHLTPEDTDLAGAVRRFVTACVPPAVARPEPAAAAAVQAPYDRRVLWAALAAPTIAATDAIVEPGPASRGTHELTDVRRVSFGELAEDVRDLAIGFAQHGVRPGQRVACLVPPGRELATVLAALWRLGAVVVIADAGLGPRGLSRALRSAAPDHVVGIDRALAAATALRWPGTRIAAGEVPDALRAASGATTSTSQLRAAGARALEERGGQSAAQALLPEPPEPDALAAIAFTSGSTGPPKGVRYQHAGLEAQRDALVRTYGIRPDDRLVAAFAPFALYGPLMGITSMVPDMDVTAPASLTATALADAVVAVGATLVFASPAALANVVATSAALRPHHREALGGVRLLLSAGAPVPAELLRRCTALMPRASAHTPYGMTEVLPVADIDLATIDAVGPGPGVCVGHPVPDVEVALSPLVVDGHAPLAAGGGAASGESAGGFDDDGLATGALTSEPGITGEVCVRARHVKEGYDRLALTELAASRDAGWHRSGDVGHLDADGRLWIEGRLAHVITTAEGVVTPVAIERRVETIAHVRLAAAVGVGPPGAQQVVVVVATDPAPGRAQLAPLTLVDRVRAAVADVTVSVSVGPPRGGDAPDREEPSDGVESGEGVAFGAAAESGGAPGVAHRVDVAAVLAVPALPVDIRHQSKIDRAAVARHATEVLAGRSLPGGGRRS